MEDLEATPPGARKEVMLYACSAPARYFTPKEANELLPTIRAYLLKIREHARALLELERASDQEESGERRAEIEMQKANRERGQAHLLERLGQLGAEILEPIELGNVRFPAMRNGEPVWLVWHVGEPRVSRWVTLGGAPLFGAHLDDATGRVRWEWRN